MDRSAYCLAVKNKDQQTFLDSKSATLNKKIFDSMSISTDENNKTKVLIVENFQKKKSKT